ncbi:MAG: MerR family transcriptional regulator [bacterium]|nr:MerR family transcriptional regulator [bacterium]
MEYRVDEIARAAGVSVDTVRFYQARGLLPAPERRGRIAIYGEDHLERLRRIRQLNKQGFTLEAVRRVIDRPEAETADAGLREALQGALAEAEGDRSYTRSQLAASSGVPEMLLEVLDRAGLLEPAPSEDESLYTDSDLRTVESARLLLDHGFPLHELMPLALEHADHVAEITDRAIDLFDRYIRHPGDEDETGPREQVTEAFRQLLPSVTTLVALHFQRTLIQRARARLDGSGDSEALKAALEATEGRRLRVSWGS